MLNDSPEVRELLSDQPGPSLLRATDYQKITFFEISPCPGGGSDRNMYGWK